MLQRVQKVIANAGLTSRRKAEDLIVDGKVKVNGKVITIGDKADPDKDTVTVDGKRIELGKKIYVMLNKPPDCLTTLDDPRGRKTVLDYLPFKTRLIPVGRLDFKSEGLLLLTNDGDWANKVMHPRYEVEKTYQVVLDKEFIYNDIEKVKKGMWIDEFGTKTRPAKVRYASDDKMIIEITIHEGKNRIIRRMMDEMGYKVLRLKRIKVGKLVLGDLRLGAHRKLSFKEIESFK